MCESVSVCVCVCAYGTSEREEKAEEKNNNKNNNKNPEFIADARASERERMRDDHTLGEILLRTQPFSSVMRADNYDTGIILFVHEVPHVSIVSCE